MTTRATAHARQAFLGALTTWGLAGVLALVGYESVAVGTAVFGFAELAWAVTYVIQYRV